MPPENTVDITKEIQDRILNLENRRKEVEDLIPWRQNEFPKFAKELESLKVTLHELRADLAELRGKPPTAPAPTGEVKASDDDGGIFPWD